MKRAVITILLIVVSLSSCIYREHVGRNYDMKGYVGNIVGYYYYSCVFKFDHPASEANYIIIETGPDSWRIESTGTQIPEWLIEDIDYYQADITMDITIDQAGVEHINMSGTIVEDDITTTITTPGEILDRSGIIRVEVSVSGVPQGWGEAAVSPDNMADTVTTGTF